MKRRNFLRSLSAISAPMMLGKMPLSAINPLAFSGFLNGNSDKILVLVQLIGGNDGLNTLVPLDQYGILSQLRSNIIIPEQQLLQIGDNNGFHPAMTGMKQLFDDGMLHIIQDVGYPDQDRSHFRSTDIWMSASQADETLNTGWIGRHLTDEFPTYPHGFPNIDCPDPIAMTIGSFISETCQGSASNYSLAVGDIDQIRALNEPVSDGLPDNCYGEELGFLIESINKANAYVGRITEAESLGNNLSTKYTDRDKFHDQLKTAAKLITGGLQTKVYVLSIGGFDTHAAQVGTDTTTGSHADLLASLSDGMQAFYEDLAMQGMTDKVVSMTFSEFGRQIKSNLSLGTDHGTAAPLFVFGECVNPGITGVNTPLDVNIPNQTGMPMQYDFRDVYGSILEKWFETPVDNIKNNLYDGYQALPIFNDSCIVGTEDLIGASNTSNFSAWPIPTFDKINIQSQMQLSDVHIELYDIKGARILSSKQSFNQGQSHFLHLNQLPSGTYFLRFFGNNYAQVIQIQKV